MSKRDERNRGRWREIAAQRIHCPTGKIGWSDRRVAKSEMRRLSIRNRAAGDHHPLNTYWCDQLDGHWHVGHEPKGEYRPNLNDPHFQEGA